MKRYFSGLWQHPDFMKLWTGQTISEFGSRITRDALPLVAVITLAASPSQMSILTVIGSIPILLFGLLIGVWVDRLPRRPLMIAADLGRMLILLSIPAAALTGRLGMELLYVVIAATGLLSLVFSVAYRSLLPSLVGAEHILEGNTKLSTTDSLAEIGGPALAGLLVQIITAPLAIFFDAVSFLFSAVSLALIRAPEAPPAPRPTRRNFRHEIADGFRVILENQALRALVVSILVSNFFGSFLGTLYGYYVIRELGLSPAMLGLIVGVGGVGALLGTLAAPSLVSRFGLGRTLTGAMVLGSLVNLLMPLASGPIWWAVGCLLTCQIAGDAIWAVYDINERTLVQTLAPNLLLGRVNAGIGFLREGVGPVGALAAGALATAWGARPVMWIATLGILTTALWFWGSPVRRMETAPSASAAD